jgi:hypothetical protein
VELEHGDASFVQHVWKITDELQFGALDITLEQVDDWLGGEQLRNVDELDFYALFRGPNSPDQAAVAMELPLVHRPDPGSFADQSGDHAHLSGQPVVAKDARPEVCDARRAALDGGDRRVERSIASQPDGINQPQCEEADIRPEVDNAETPGARRIQGASDRDVVLAFSE